MIGKVHRIIGTFNPNIGMTLAASLTGGVAYGYKRTSWPEIQKWSEAREFYFLELESQKSFSHLKKMPNLQHFIIEETDILLPEYGTGSFEQFANEIKSLVVNHGMNVYFNSTWKEEELSKALEQVGIKVHSWNTEKKIVEEVVETKVEPVIVEKKEVVVKKPVKVEKKHVEKPKPEKKPIEVKRVVEEKPKKVVEEKPIEIKKPQHQQKPKEKYQGENKQQIPEDLELFYSQPKTRWQKIRAYFSRKIEKIVNNF